MTTTLSPKDPGHHGVHARTERLLVRRPGPRELHPERTHRSRRTLELSLAVAVPLVLVLLWQLAAGQCWIDDRIYPAPSDDPGRRLGPRPAGELWPDVWATLQRVLAGYAIGTVTGYVLGLLMGSLHLVRAALEPLLDALYVVPKLALLPVFLNMFGLGEGPQVALVAATVFFFVWISTMAAVLAVPAGHRDAGQVFGASALADVPPRPAARVAARRPGRCADRRGRGGPGHRRLRTDRGHRRPRPPDLRLARAVPERRDVRRHRLCRRPRCRSSPNWSAWRDACSPPGHRATAAAPRTDPWTSKPEKP